MVARIYLKSKKENKQKDILKIKLFEYIRAYIVLYCIVLT